MVLSFGPLDLLLTQNAAVEPENLFFLSVRQNTWPLLHGNASTHVRAFTSVALAGSTTEQLTHTLASVLYFTKRN